ncbi:hypothetical protein ACFVXH_22190 [Kitasatospora sp. NPDC058184]|uniref:hypothetical protein n=1 Tax=Kitasatospora sp. NPDC058184 TaxID=3346370 RepID=UPI0036DEFBE2
MTEGGTNEMTKDPTADPDGTAAEEHADGPRELSRAAAVVVTLLAALSGAAVLLAVFHWLGWGVPWVGWMVAKAGIKLAVGGFAGLAVGFAWLRGRLRARPRN